MNDHRPYHNPDAMGVLDMLVLLAFMGPLVIGTWTLLVYATWIILAWSGAAPTDPSFWPAFGIATAITVARLVLAIPARNCDR